MATAVGLLEIIKMPEELLREIIDRILYGRQKTPWSVLGEKFGADLQKQAQPVCPGPIDTEVDIRASIAAELWKLYGPGTPYEA